MNIPSRGVNNENLQAIRNRCLFLCNVGLHHSIAKFSRTVELDKNLKREFCKSVSAIFKKVEVQFSAVISLVVNSECLVRVTRTTCHTYDFTFDFVSHIRF